MRLSRAFPFALALALWPLAPAMAQFGGMPGMPGSPGMGPGPGSPFGAAPQAPPAQCQQLLTYRDETQKHGQALQAAGKKKLPPDEVCKLFKAFLGAESKMIKGLEDNSSTCGVPAEVIKQVKTSHDRAAQMGKQVCELAPQGRFAPPPHCSETLQPIPCVD